MTDSPKAIPLGTKVRLLRDLHFGVLSSKAATIAVTVSPRRLYSEMLCQMIESKPGEVAAIRLPKRGVCMAQADEFEVLSPRVVLPAHSA